MWEKKKSRKRGYRSPLSNAFKKQATENDISELLKKYKNSSEDENGQENDDEVTEDESEHVPEAGTSA